MVPQKVLWRPFFWSTTKKYDWDGKGRQSLISKRHNSSNLMINLLCGEMKFLRLLLKDRTFCRSSRSEVFCKKGVLENFTKFTGKHLCQSLIFNKVSGLRPATLLKRGLWLRCFPVIFVKLHLFYRTPPVVASVTIHCTKNKVFQ